MKFAIAIPQYCADGSFDPDAFRSYFARAEALGFDSAWALDLVLGQGPAPNLGPVEAMTYAATGALRRAVRLGSGFFGAGSTPTADFAAQVVAVRDELAAAGRPAAGFRIAKRVYIDVDPDADRARQRVNASLEGIYGRRVPSIEAAAIAGTVADCVREVRAVADAGAELICFTPLSDLPGLAGHMELIAAEIIPRVAS